MKRPNLKERILDSATDLFYREGIHATGINAIIARSEIAPMTLYKHFPSKDALIESVLRRHLEAGRRRLGEIVASLDLDPEARLWLVFDDLGRAVRSEGFFGCPFINASAEYSDAGHAFHRIAVEYKRAYRDHVRKIVEAMGVSDPEALSAQLALLIDGALVGVQVDPDHPSVEHAVTAARALVAFHRADSSSALSPT